MATLPFLLSRTLALTLLAMPCAGAQQDPLAAPPRQWAADAAGNEVKVLQYGTSFLRYRIHAIDSKGDQVRDVIESKDGPVARLIYKEGRPLTADEDADERARLQAMLDSPSAYAKHVRNDAGGKKYAVEMIGQMPDAMLYSYAPGQPQRAHLRPGSAPEIVLDFVPNPAWSSPSMATQALTG